MSTSPSMKIICLSSIVIALASMGSMLIDLRSASAAEGLYVMPQWAFRFIGVLVGAVSLYMCYVSVKLYKKL